MFSNKFMLRISTVNITEFSTKSLAVLPGTKRQMLLSSKQPHTMKYFWKHFSEKLYSTLKTKEKKMEVMFWSDRPSILWYAYLTRSWLPLMLKPVPPEVPLNLKQCYGKKYIFQYLQPISSQSHNAMSLQWINSWSRNFSLAS